MGGAKIPEGVPISLGNLAWGCQILGGARFPMTPGTSVVATVLGNQAAVAPTVSASNVAASVQLPVSASSSVVAVSSGMFTTRCAAA